MQLFAYGKNADGSCAPPPANCTGGDCGEWTGECRVSEIAEVTLPLKQEV